MPNQKSFTLDFTFEFFVHCDRLTRWKQLYGEYAVKSLATVYKYDENHCCYHQPRMHY